MPVFLTTLGSAVAKNWKLLGGAFVMGLLGSSLLIAKSDAHHWHTKYDNAEAGRQNEIKAHAITRASVETCTSALHDQNAAVDKLRIEATTRAVAAATAIRDAEKASLAAEMKARALLASAAKPAQGTLCVGSETYQAVRDEL